MCKYFTKINFAYDILTYVMLIVRNKATIIDCVCQCCFKNHLISYFFLIFFRSKKKTGLFLFLHPISNKNEIFIL